MRATLRASSGEIVLTLEDDNPALAGALESKFVWHKDRRYDYVGTQDGIAYFLEVEAAES